MSEWASSARSAPAGGRPRHLHGRLPVLAPLAAAGAILLYARRTCPQDAAAASSQRGQR